MSSLRNANLSIIKVIKKNCKKKLVKKYQSLSKEEEEEKKSGKMVVNVTKTYKKVKNNCWLSIEKYYKMIKKMPYCVCLKS